MDDDPIPLFPRASVSFEAWNYSIKLILLGLFLGAMGTYILLSNGNNFWGGFGAAGVFSALLLIFIPILIRLLVPRIWRRGRVVGTRFHQFVFKWLAAVGIASFTLPLSDHLHFWGGAGIGFTLVGLVVLRI